MPQPEDFASPEEVLGTETKYRGRIIKLEVKKVRERSGRETSREIVTHPGSVGMVVTDGAGNVLLLRQWRSAVNRWLYEIPAGTREEDESAETCAAREVEEETGYHPARIDHLGGFYLAPGYSTEYMDFYLASDLSKGTLTAEDDENIELMPMTLDEAVELILNGEIEDVKTIAGILMYKLMR
jgi:8-oxo-dGTP pyrophosphatase MutT (NUDIX family)